MLRRYLVFMYEKHLFSILAAAFVISYIVSVSDMPEKSIIFPKLLLYGGVPILAWNLIAATVDFVRTERKSRQAKVDKHAKTMGLDRKKLVVAASTLVYVFAIQILSFGFSSIVYMAFLTYYLGVRSPVKIVLYIAIYFAFIYAVFEYWMGLRFPKGILF